MTTVMMSWTFDFISCQALATLETTQIASDNVAGTEDALLTFEQLLVELKSDGSDPFTSCVLTRLL